MPVGLDLNEFWVVLGIVGLCLAGIAIVAFGVLATVANYDVHGPVLGWLFSNQLWAVLAELLAVVLRLALELCAALRSNR